MAGCRLRVYFGPEETTEQPSSSERHPLHRVSVSLGDILATLVEASNDGRRWLDDFQDDEVTISTDLYEVILASQHYRRPSA